MASEDLSDEALYRVNPDAVTASDAARLLAEVRRRRALDLTAEEVEALRWARALADVTGWMTHQRHDPAVADHVAQCERFAAVLDKLIATHEEP